MTDEPIATRIPTPASLWLSAANQAAGWWMGHAANAVRAQQRAMVNEMMKPVATKPKRSRKKAVAAEVAAEPAVEAAPVPEPVAEEAPAKPKRSRKKAVEPAPEPVAADGAEPEAAEADGEGGPRRGWWQRTFGA